MEQHFEDAVVFVFVFAVVVGVGVVVAARLDLVGVEWSNADGMGCIVPPLPSGICEKNYEGILPKTGQMAAF